MTCNCQHCIEIKRQLERAAKRQTELMKLRSSQKPLQTHH